MFCVMIYCSSEFGLMYNWSRFITQIIINRLLILFRWLKMFSFKLFSNYSPSNSSIGLSNQFCELCFPSYCILLNYILFRGEECRSWWYILQKTITAGFEMQKFSLVFRKYIPRITHAFGLLLSRRGRQLVVCTVFSFRKQLLNFTIQLHYIN